MEEAKGPEAAQPLSFDALLDIVKSREFILGGPEYGERFYIDDPAMTAGYIQAGYSLPSDLNDDKSRLRRIKERFYGNPRDQELADEQLQKDLHAELDRKYGPEGWKLARIVSKQREAKGDDSHWRPDYIVLLKPVPTTSRT